MTLISAIKAIRAAATEKDALAVLEAITTEAESAEREACAQVCDDSCTNHGKRKGGSDTGDSARRNCAAKIRMRSNAELRGATDD